MKLSECEVRPGVVLKVINSTGEIKASVVGIFSDEDDPDLLPPIIPFFLISPTSFSAPHEGDKIWVWSFRSNPQELFYTFRADIGENNINSSTLDNDYKDIEIGMKRSSEKGNIDVQYNDDDGYSITNSDSKFRIDNNEHDIHLEHAEGPAVSISKDGISLGKDGKSQYSAVCGEELINTLNDIKSVFEAIKQAAMGSPYTIAIGTAMTPALSKLQNFNNILSKIVTLEK